MRTAEQHATAPTCPWRAMEESSRRARESITEAIGLLEALARMCEARAAANTNAEAEAARHD